uniref:Uncharacterized protein n=1 Tax=Plectus sambesii TaxID=2011161 RepID=A0A914X3P1_9BILA
MLHDFVAKVINAMANEIHKLLRNRRIRQHGGHKKDGVLPDGLRKQLRTLASRWRRRTDSLLDETVCCIAVDVCMHNDALNIWSINEGRVRDTEVAVVGVRRAVQERRASLRAADRAFTEHTRMEVTMVKAQRWNVGE